MNLLLCFGSLKTESYISSFLDCHFPEIRIERRQSLMNRMNVSLHASCPSIESAFKKENNSEWIKSAFHEYAAMQENIGCQVKMLNGYNCFANRNITTIMLDRAIARLYRMKFVGMTDKYTESVIKFHQKYVPNSSFPIHDIELVTFRTTARFDEAKRILQNERYDYDSYDTVLYTHALEIFGNYTK